MRRCSRKPSPLGCRQRHPPSRASHGGELLCCRLPTRDEAPFFPRTHSGPGGTSSASGGRLSSTASSGRYALRVVTGGCNSGSTLSGSQELEAAEDALSPGTIHAAYLDVNTGTKTSRPMLSPPSRVCGRFCRKKDCGHEDSKDTAQKQKKGRMPTVLRMMLLGLYVI